MRVLIDNPVSWRVGRALRAVGHDAVHVADLGMANAPDTAIYRHALSEQRIIITQDSDFDAIHMSVSARTGVVLLRTSNGTPAYHSALLIELLGTLAADLERGAFVLVDDAVIRVRG